MGKSIFEYLAKDNLRAKFLDRTIPLDGASHADVVEYAVDTPMRYSECCARLADGRRARLRDPRQFVAWSGRGSRKQLLFQGRLGRIEVQTDANSAIGVVRRAAEDRRFVGRDGSQRIVRHWGRVFAVSLGLAPRELDDQDRYAVPQLQSQDIMA